MGFLRGSHSDEQIPYYTGLQIQTSSRNVPIAIVWGSNKIAPNCIWTGGFYGYYGYPEGSHGSSGGKCGSHGSSGSSASQSWQYYTSWEMALCEGPIDSLGTIWLGQNATNYYGAGIWAEYLGTWTQNPWGILAAKGWPGQALSYRGVAYVTSYNFYLGSNASLPQLSFEVHGLLLNSAGLNGRDADPALVIDQRIRSAYGGCLSAAESSRRDCYGRHDLRRQSGHDGRCGNRNLALAYAICKPFSG